MLVLLPAETLIQVCSHLGYRDLLTCSLVCRLLHTVVRENASCQYIIDLAVSGMKDGPPSAMGCADRLTALRNSQAAWHALQWTTSKDIRMFQGSLYELYGGVLVQSTQPGGRGLVFRRLASHYRGIEERMWSLELDCTLRDFTLDPAQDLLVVIAQPVVRPGTDDARIVTPIHLLSLTTGKGHPLASSPVLVHDVDLRAANLTFTLQVHSDRVGVHFVSHGLAPSELVVWNWRTGETLLNTYGEDLMAFAFLTEHLILVGGFGDAAFNLRRPRLFVIDLERSKGARTEVDRVEYLCAFLYPVCYPWVLALSFLIRSDPCTDWSPHGSAGGVPFSIGGGPRLYVVTIWVMHGEEMSPIDLFVLSSTLLEYVGMAREDGGGRDFEWSEWGPGWTRMVAHTPHSHVWVCYVFGTRFSLIVGGRGSRVLEVWDFNQLGIERDASRARGEAEWHVGDTSVLSSRVFVGDVRTRLPYRVFRRGLAEEEQEGEEQEQAAGGYAEAMCSEDSVILVDAHRRRFRILTF